MLLIHWLSLREFCVCSLFCYAVNCVLSSFAIILMGKRKLTVALIVFLVSCDCRCSVVLPHSDRV